MLAQNPVLKKARGVEIRKGDETDGDVQFFAIASSPDKIVKYEWEVSPFVANKTQKNNTLSLYKLKFTTYKIKVTVKDSEGYTFYSKQFSYTKTRKQPQLLTNTEKKQPAAPSPLPIASS